MARTASSISYRVGDALRSVTLPERYSLAASSPFLPERRRRCDPRGEQARPCARLPRLGQPQSYQPRLGRDCAFRSLPMGRASSYPSDPVPRAIALKGIVQKDRNTEGSQSQTRTSFGMEAGSGHNGLRQLVDFQNQTMTMIVRPSTLFACSPAPHRSCGS